MNDPYARPDENAVRGLLRYLGAVAAELGAEGTRGCAEGGPPTCGRLVVNGHLASFPDRDVVLVWDEEYGWAAAVAVDGHDQVVLAYLGDEVLPPATGVAEFARALLRGEHPGDPRPVRLRAVGDADDLMDRLSRYAPG